VFSEPIGAAITYANAALNWLRPQPPNLEEARRALGLIVDASIWAADVIDGIRALVKKAPPTKGQSGDQRSGLGNRRVDST
jgi:hypothetical protein